MNWSRTEKNDDDEMAHAALTTKFGIYMAMRDMVARIRAKHPNDELGWDNYLGDQESMNAIGTRDGIGSGKKKIRTRLLKMITCHWTLWPLIK